MSEQELINALAAEDVQPSAELTKLEQEIDNLDPSKLHIGIAARLLVHSKNHKLVYRVTEIPITTGHGDGPKEGNGSFYGPPVPSFFPQSHDQVYLLRVKGGDAFLTLRKDHKIVFHGKYTGVQRGLDGIWKGKWNQLLRKD